MTENTVPIVPRKTFMGNPDKANLQLSPDGSHISYLAPLDGVLNIWVAPAEDLEEAVAVTADTGRGIRWYCWTYLPGVLLFRMDSDGDENFHIYSVNTASKEQRDLTPMNEVSSLLMHASHLHPETVLLGINDRDPHWHDVFSVNLKTGSRERVLQNDGFASYLFDLDMELVAGVRTLDDGGLECMLRKADRWEQLFRVGPEDGNTSYPLGTDIDDRLWLMWSVDRDTAALVSVDLEEDSWKTHAEHPRADLSGRVLHHPRTLRPQAALFDYIRREYSIIDDDIRGDIEYLKTVHRGDLTVVDRTLDDRSWLVKYNVDDGSQRFHIYHREEGKAEELCAMRPELDELKLSRMHPVVISSSDELDLVSYYTLPPWLDNPDGNPPEEPLPSVLVVHGGPWGRDYWRYNPTHQWLANRGYFVISTNFRASTGFGKAFLNAGNGEWAGTMHKDLLDTVAWAVAEGYSDPERVAIFGGSYGGYATLVGLTFTPEVFACGVDIVGPSNLVTLLSDLPPYWLSTRPMMRQRIGALPDSDEGRKYLMERSPLSRADRIARPLLIGQGANDPRVRKVESDQIAEAMKDKGLPVTYLLYPDEGHGFQKPENRLSFFAVAEQFLAQHIGGRYQPMEDDLEGSSMEVVDSGGLESI